MKTSKLRLAFVMILGCGSIVSMAQLPVPQQTPPAAPVASATPFAGFGVDDTNALRHFTIRGKFDADYIKFQNGELWMEHIAFDKPTEMMVNGIHWNPTWEGNKSGHFVFKVPVSPFGNAKVRVRKLLGRSEIASIDLPSAKNKQTLTIKAIDQPVGVDMYEFEVTW
jgi:hypothetical protein